MKQILFKTVLSIFLTVISLSAQQYSVYSRFGIGSIENSLSAGSAGLSGLGIASLQKDYISTTNPAGWSALKTTRFQVGTVLNGNFASDVNASNYAAQAYFSGFSFAFPVSRSEGIGVALGLLPYSSVNYEIQSKGNDSRINSNYVNRAFGEGGLAKLFLGSSWKPVGGFSVGAAMNYYFGKLSFNNSLTFDDGVSSTASFTKSYRMKGVGFDLGLITPELSAIPGVKEVVRSVSAGITMNFFNDFTSDSLYSGGNSIVIDTLHYGAGSVTVPFRLGFGLSISVNERTDVFADFSSQAWTSYKYNGSQRADLQDMYRFGAAIEHRERDRDRNFDAYIYRGGVYYEKTPYFINGTQISEIGVSAGMSFSLTPESYFDAALQFISRGSKDNGLIRENIVRLNVGMSLGELWFLQQER